MSGFFEQLIASMWNRLAAGRRHPTNPHSLHIGHIVTDNQATTHPAAIAQAKRPEHIVVLGKTGSGKSVFLRYVASHDITAGRGFCFFDLHGDATEILLSYVAYQEQVTRADLSGKLIVIEPADREFSVGLNVLEQRDTQHSFVQIAEFAHMLKQRWQLDSFGARTEEILRNSLHVLADNNLTLLELSPLLTDAGFRAMCLRRTSNSEVKAYFQSRYDLASDAMQSVFRDAILNKVTAFTADPHFRHILGQRESSFSLLDALDHGSWIILNLDKGRLGEQAATLASLFLTKLKNALFARRSRQLYTLYCDEIQNLVAIDSGLDTLLSEARKFGISVVTANQFLDQHPAAMRSALLSVGSYVFFQLASGDADKIAAVLDGGKSLASLLKNLPPRNIVVKTGHHRWMQVRVPDVTVPRVNTRDLYNRCRQRWARRRTDVEIDIRRRVESAVNPTANTEVLHDWE
jgi:hypothetical protein